MCDKAAENCAHALEFVLEYQKTQKSDKAVDTCPPVFDSVPNQYQTQEMCDKVVDVCLPALKFIPDWFVANKMLGKLDNSVISNGDIFFVMQILIL